HSGGRRGREARGRRGWRGRASSYALTLAARLPPVLGGGKNHFSFYFVYHPPTKCRLPAWAGVGIFWRRRGDPAPISGGLSPGARGQRALLPHGGLRSHPLPCWRAARAIFPIWVPRQARRRSPQAISAKARSRPV